MVLAFPAKFPVTLPTTLPATFPVNAAVTVPALKLPLASLLTNVLTVLVEVAALIVVLIDPIVEEFTPPTLFTVGASAVPPKSLANFIIPFAMLVASVAEFDICALTNAAVATSVPFALATGVGAVGLPVKEGEEMVGDTIVLFVKDSVPVKVAMVPVVGKVIFVTPVLINVVLKLPEVVKSLAVKILPPKVIVLDPLFTPVPP